MLSTKPAIGKTTDRVLQLIERIKTQDVTVVNFRELLDRILELQDAYPNGPDWYVGYSALFESWIGVHNI